MNRLLGGAFILTVLGALWPLVALDAGSHYLEFVIRNPSFAAMAGAAWLMALYWALRRAAEILLLRRSGAKLQIRGPWKGKP